MPMHLQALWAEHLGGEVASAGGDPNAPQGSFFDPAALSCVRGIRKAAVANWEVFSGPKVSVSAMNGIKSKPEDDNQSHTTFPAPGSIH